jgi:hypothetical protein
MRGSGSAEHQAYAAAPVQRVPRRLRVEMPVDNDPPIDSCGIQL